MPLNIREFNSSIGLSGLLRDNRFEVQLGIPRGLLQGGAMAHLAREVAKSVITCEKAVLPGTTIVLNEVRRYGYGVTEPKPVAARFVPADFVFRCGDDGAVYDMLHAWQQLAVNMEHRNGINVPNGPATGAVYPQELGYKADYSADVVVTAYAQDGSKAIEVVLRDAYPVNIGNIDVNWANKGNYLRVAAQFVYTDWFQRTGLFTTGTGAF